MSVVRWFTQDRLLDVCGKIAFHALMTDQRSQWEVSFLPQRHNGIDARGTSRRYVPRHRGDR